MSRTFPLRFEPESFSGPRADQYHRREDVFQQLVGDALREQWGSNVFVAPTKGRDGGIDAYVTASTNALSVVHGVPVPAILECKDHDDQLSRVGQNVLAGWRAVEKKLREQANAGWPALYRPWRSARGYVYCISAVLPTEETRAQLTSEISRFFQSLPLEQRPPIESVRVIDWPAIRHWLDGFARVADRWLGIGLSSLLSHEEYLRSLEGFRQLLLDTHLSFVAPHQEAPYHPDRLLERAVALVNKRGILLVGPGGIGKTRSLLEVAARANASGWRVLHALPGESALTTEELSDVILQGGASTIVLIDYLDQMRLDLEAMRRRLLPEVRKRNHQLVLIANARPAYEVREATEWPLLFERIELRPSEAHLQQIAIHVEETISPQAIRILGKDRVALLCGTRPIIALFIARELERRAQEGSLTTELVADLRSADLLAWLRRRLREDDLSLTPATSILLPPQPSDEVVAAAAVLAASPQGADVLQQTAERVIRLGALLATEQEISQRGGFLVDVLCNLGWLEWRETFLAPAHDVVIDEVLEETVRVASSGAIRRGALIRILNGSSYNPRTVGRYSVSFGRLIEQIRGRGGTLLERNLRQALDEWFMDTATDLGKALLAADPDESSYALGAILSGPPWAETVVVFWARVVEPWLRKYETTVETRHVLYRGLRELKGEPAQALMNTANTWLSYHDREFEATFVLGPLLARNDLAAGTARSAIDHALAWLVIGDHRTSTSASFVLQHLLAREELQGETARSAIDHALAWLAIDEHRTSTSARFVLSHLLALGELQGETARSAIDHALAWLAIGDHRTSTSASFVLQHLLARGELQGETARSAIDHALAWLAIDEHRTTTSASFVLPRLLAREELQGETARSAIDHALAWLAIDEHRTSTSANFVLHQLFTRGELEAETAQTVINYSLSWLATNKHATDSTADYVIRSLLGRTDLKADSARRVIDTALNWLATGQHGSHPDADFLISRLVARSDLSEADVAKAVGHAFTWLAAGEHRITPDASFLFRRLLAREDLGPIASQRLMEESIAWLEVHALQPEPLTPEEIERLHRGAFAWTDMTVTFVLNAFLRRAQPGLFLERAVMLAVTWWRSNRARDDRGFTLISLLTHWKLLEADVLQDVISDSLTWLRERRRSEATADALLTRLHTATHETALLLEVARLEANYREQPDDTVDHGFATRKASPFRRLIAEIEELVGQAVPPSPEFIRRAHNAILTQLQLDAGALAAWALPGLLPLVARTRDPNVIESTRIIAAKIIATLTQRQLIGLAHGSYRFVDAGAWPDVMQGAAALESLGIKRPS